MWGEQLPGSLAGLLLPHPSSTLPWLRTVVGWRLQQQEPLLVTLLPHHTPLSATTSTICSDEDEG